MVEAQSPRLLYSATLGIDGLILPTPTGLWQCFSYKDSPVGRHTRANFGCNPVGVGELARVFPRVAEYTNPGLTVVSPSGNVIYRNCPLHTGH